MPFQEFSIMSQREELCRLAMMPGANIRGLARRFGISPETAYKWLGRYRAGGPGGLSDRSRCPKTSPWRTAGDVEAQVVALRAEHPCWGGRKLHALLAQAGVERVPSPSTITEILRRHGKLTVPRRVRRVIISASSMPSPTTCGRWTSRATLRWAQVAATR